MRRPARCSSPAAREAIPSPWRAPTTTSSTVTSGTSPISTPSLVTQCSVRGRRDRRRTTRSEEHTSELPSRFDLVCRLLLEKKKKKKNIKTSLTNINPTKSHATIHNITYPSYVNTKTSLPTVLPLQTQYHTPSRYGVFEVSS